MDQSKAADYLFSNQSSSNFSEKLLVFLIHVYLQYYWLLYLSQFLYYFTYAYYHDTDEITDILLKIKRLHTTFEIWSVDGNMIAFYGNLVKFL
jgi:hypothetical protein